MPRWLSSLLILIGFLALVALAVLPRNVSVNVQVDSNVNQETTHNNEPGAADDSER